MKKAGKIDPIYIRIGGAILFIVIARYLWLSAGKNRAYKVPQPPVDPNYLDPSEDYAKLAYQVFDAVDGIDWTSKKVAIFEKLLSLNDQEFINVYNIYNSTYAKKGRTMKTDIESEWIWGSGTRALADRFNRLNLS